MTLRTAFRSMSLVQLVQKASTKTRWALEGRSALAELRRNGDQFTYVDIGSSGGVPTPYRRASRIGIAKLVLVDPQDDWRSSEAVQHEYDGCVVYPVPYALGRASQSQAFFVASNPSCSSCLEPDFEVLAKYPVSQWFRTVDTRQVAVRAYREVSREMNLPQPDIVKIDVQGLEMQVLEGFGEILDQVSCVELEVNFERIYKGQPTICEMYDFMRDHGFVLRDLQPQGPFERQAIECNGYWARPLRSERQARIERFWEAAHGIWPGLTLAQYEERAGQLQSGQEP